MLESWHVVLRCCARLLLVGGAGTYSALTPALGLGDITVHSALNQPLRADIALVDTAGLEEGELSVKLATAQEFSRAGVDRMFFLNDLKFIPILRGNRSLIRVSSNKPVNEPFLNFLVQLNQPNGRLLREYTVLIDLPGAPGIDPVADEPIARSQSSAFPTGEPAVAPVPAPKSKRPATPRVDEPAPVPVVDPLVEQLAASVLQNQQLQTTIDELKATVQGQDEQIAGQKKQVTDLHTQLAEIKQAPAVTPVAVAPVPVPVVEEAETSHWPLIFGLLALVCLLSLGLIIRRHRQQVQTVPDPALELSTRHRPELSRAAPSVAQSPASQPVSSRSEKTPASDVPEGVNIYLAYGRFTEAADLQGEALIKEPQRTDLAVQRNAGFDEQKLQDIRARNPTLSSALPLAATATFAPPAAATNEPAPIDEFQLNLDDLSMDSSWDQISPFENTLSAALDDHFLNEFTNPGESLALEPLSLAPAEPCSTGKLEQTQNCIDDGNLDSAIELLNELLKEGNEPLKQTARNLLTGLS